MAICLPSARMLLNTQLKEWIVYCPWCRFRYKCIESLEDLADKIRRKHNKKHHPAEIVDIEEGYGVYCQPCNFTITRKRWDNAIAQMRIHNRKYHHKNHSLTPIPMPSIKSTNKR